MFTRALIVSALVLLCGCNREPEAPNAEENRQLDDVANLLNQAPANLDAIDDYGLDGNNAVAPEEPN
ncbi:hypothetical protein LZ016_08870 [Sphingomonas sp. SM33]|uniref:Secreted protein n=1 Tax=Sphingomonas telluris TaxID=2907998 RepID=A0ABS9VNW8_9SPHN|nr:hypothetical protein [Sphingomonas telluris]MCH8616209.1 hypothetical protein [Sphingomonas telluris]